MQFQSDEHGHLLAADTGMLQSREQHVEHHAVGCRAGEVGDDDADGVSGVDTRTQAWSVRVRDGRPRPLADWDRFIIRRSGDGHRHAGVHRYLPSPSGTSTLICVLSTAP